MQGKVIGCINQGTLVQILVKTGVEGVASIPVDHRCFRHIVETKDNLEGKEIEYDEENGLIFFKEDGQGKKC